MKGKGKVPAVGGTDGGGDGKGKPSVGGKGQLAVGGQGAASSLVDSRDSRRRQATSRPTSRWK